MRKIVSLTVLCVVLYFVYFPANAVAQKIELTWNPNPEDDIKYYEIYRSSSVIPETKIAEVPAKDMAYFDYDIVVGDTYNYRITAVDSADNVSEFSQMIEVETDITTTVAPPSDGIPENFELSQNYPNPFNPETKFTYFVAEQAEVSLVIYDLLGKKVKTLVDENKEAGTYSTTWDGRDELGRKLTTGIYFARMVAGKFGQTKKLVLQK